MRKRHAWTRVRVHVYCCRQCGTVYQNVETQPGQWARVWSLADGTVTHDYHTPPCEVGRNTAARLERLQKVTAVSA